MLRRRHLLVTSALALGLTACATAAPAPVHDNDEVALILATPTYELHLRDGHVYRVKGVNGEPADATTEEVETYQEFKALYEARSEDDLPPTMPPAGVTVTGRRGLDCVRAGHACGTAPNDPVAAPAVRLRLAFPQRK